MTISVFPGSHHPASPAPVLLHLHPDLKNVETLLDEIDSKGAGAQRDAMVKRVYRLVGPLIDERVTLEQKLGSGMDWLAENEGHPQFDAREGKWNQWEQRYRAVHDLLDRAHRTLGSWQAVSRSALK